MATLSAETVQMHGKARCILLELGKFLSKGLKAWTTSFAAVTTPENYLQRSLRKDTDAMTKRQRVWLHHPPRPPQYTGLRNVFSEDVDQRRLYPQIEIRDIEITQPQDQISSVSLS